MQVHFFPSSNQKLQVVPLPREAFGKFFNGDAYIIFSCSEYGEPGGLQGERHRHSLGEILQPNTDGEVPGAGEGGGFRFPDSTKTNPDSQTLGYVVDGDGYDQQ